MSKWSFLIFLLIQSIDWYISLLGSLLVWEPWSGFLHCMGDLIPQNHIRFHYHLRFICRLLLLEEKESTRRLGAALIVVWFTVGLFASDRCAVRNNNKMEAKRRGEGRGGRRAGLVTEGMMYWSRLTGCCGPINPDGQEEPVRRFSWVVRVTQTTGNGREINWSSKREWMHAKIDGRINDRER